MAPILLEENRALPASENGSVRAGASELDRERLRGIPVVGVGGAIHGSEPGRDRRLDEWRPPPRG